MQTETNRYVVNENEYLIMEPGQQFGFAPSLCTFYWLHFDCLFFGFKDEPVIFLPNQGQISSQNRIHNAFLELNNANFVYHDEQTNSMYTMQILLELIINVLIIPTGIIYYKMSKLRQVESGIPHHRIRYCKAFGLSSKISFCPLPQRDRHDFKNNILFRKHGVCQKPN